MIEFENPYDDCRFVAKVFNIFINLKFITYIKKYPNIIVIHAINFMFLSSLIKLVFTKKKPTKITGIEEIRIFIKIFVFFAKFKKSLRK